MMFTITLRKGVCMLNAKQAREKTDANKLTLSELSVEKAIQKAIEKGNDKIYLTDSINQQLIEKLKANGYTVTKQATGMKVSW